MIVVRVELHSAVTGKVETLGIAHIANDGTGDPLVGNYDFTLSMRGGRGTWKSGRVEGFPRTRLGAWDLLFRALAAAVGSRN